MTKINKTTRTLKLLFPVCFFHSQLGAKVFIFIFGPFCFISILRPLDLLVPCYVPPLIHLDGTLPRIVSTIPEVISKIKKIYKKEICTAS